MPKVFDDGGYRFFFYSNEGKEPPHVHVRAGDKLAKFWLKPVAIVESFKMKPHELRHIQTIIEKRRLEIINEWNAHFKTS